MDSEVYGDFANLTPKSLKIGIEYDWNTLYDIVWFDHEYKKYIENMELYLEDGVGEFVGNCECDHCHNTYKIRLNRDKVGRFFLEEVVCDSCWEIIAKERAEYLLSMSHHIMSFCEFSEHFLKENNAGKNIGIKHFNSMLLYYTPDMAKDVCKKIREMNYKDFLTTLYWKIISYKIKHDAGFRCAVCNSNQRFEAHHRTYSIHGKEIENLRDITCLCNNSHSKHHNK